MLIKHRYTPEVARGAKVNNKYYSKVCYKIDILTNTVFITVRCKI